MLSAECESGTSRRFSCKVVIEGATTMGAEVFFNISAEVYSSLQSQHVSMGYGESPPPSKYSLPPPPPPPPPTHPPRAVGHAELEFHVQYENMRMCLKICKLKADLAMIFRG